MKHALFRPLVTRAVFLLIPVTGLVNAQLAAACASCGSGGDDPLVLAPNHDWRFYFATSRSFAFQTVTAEGRLGSENAPRFKDALTLAVGKAVNQFSFVTLTLPYLQNWKEGEYLRAFGDPLLAGRWTVLSQDIAQPWQPQVQLLAAHRFARARATQEAQHPARLDVFGQGVPETRLGADLFHGMFPYKVGAALSFLFPGERNLAGTTLSPGFGQRAVFTLGYGHSGLGKVLVGVTREERNNMRLDGREVPNSNTVDTGTFISLDAEPSPLHQTRLTWSRRSAIFKNKNSSRANTITVAWMWGVAP